MTELKKTPLHDAHVELGARMVPFAGFEMPVSYAGIIEEHRAVRQRVGVFDVSHMGEFILSGPGAFDYLNRVVTNDCSKLVDGGVLYTVMCRQDGTTVDDLLVCRMPGGQALVVVNASNIEKDFAHMRSLLPEDGTVTLEDASDRTALLAVQGPFSRDVLKSCPLFSPVKDTLDGLAYYNLFRYRIGGDEVVVSRTGYTGELGYEVFIPPARAREFWDELASHGKPFGLQPVGLAARDTLRFEASFCLYGHELDDNTTPLEAGLAWVVKLKKGGFVGRDALLAEKEAGPRRKLIGLELEERNIARQDYPIMHGVEVVGKVTSGTFSPTLEKSLAMAFVDRDRLDDAYSVQVRKKLVGATVTPLPFYPSRAK